MSLFHVYFDSKPTIEAHVCAEHRALGQAIPCRDPREVDGRGAGPDGDCAHVQTRPCDCSPPAVCDACQDWARSCQRQREAARS